MAVMIALIIGIISIFLRKVRMKLLLRGLGMKAGILLIFLLSELLIFVISAGN